MASLKKSQKHQKFKNASSTDSQSNSYIPNKNFYSHLNSTFNNPYFQMPQNQPFFPNSNAYPLAFNPYYPSMQPHMPMNYGTYVPNQPNYQKTSGNKEYRNEVNNGMINNQYAKNCNFNYINNYYICNDKTSKANYPASIYSQKKFSTSNVSKEKEEEQSKKSYSPTTDEKLDFNITANEDNIFSEDKEEDFFLSTVNIDIEKLLNSLNIDDEDQKSTSYQPNSKNSFKYETISEKIYDFSSKELKEYLSCDSNKEEIDYYFFILKNESKQLEIESLFIAIKKIFISMLDLEIASLTLRKFYFLISQERLFELWNLIYEDFITHCQGNYSSKSIQWLISELSTRDRKNQDIILEKIQEYFYKLATMKNGCNILKRIINVFDVKALEKVESFIYLNIYTLCTNVYSYHVFIAFLKIVAEKFSIDKKINLVNHIFRIVVSLMDHEIGSKIIAKAISYLGLTVCKQILNHVAYKIHVYSTSRSCIGVIHAILDYVIKEKTDQDMKYSFCLCFISLKKPQLLKIFACRRAYNIMSKACSMLNSEDKKKISTVLNEFSLSLNLNSFSAKKLTQRIKNIMCLK